MSEYKESKDNPLHKEFGIWSNTVFILRKMAQYCPSSIFLVILGVVCGSVLQYFWGIFGKYVIDIITGGYDTDTAVGRLVIVIAAAGVIVTLLTVGNSFSNAKVWYKLIAVRMEMILERIERVLNLKYEMLEKPDVLDVAERAAQATGGNYNGVEGMMHRMQEIATNAFTLVVTFVAVTVLDWRLIIALIVFGVLEFLYFRYVIKKDKKEVWDKLSPMWRQNHYMERVTQDFDFAKDIRLFSLSSFLAKKQEKIYEKRFERLALHEEMWFRYNLLARITYIIIQVCIYGALYLAIFNKDLAVGNFTMFLSLAIAFSGALTNFLNRFGDFKRASLETDDYRSFMELDVFDDEKDCMDIPEADKYEIEFVNVSYRYHKAEKDALTGLNLTLKPGEKLAVVGLNGAGKSTMIKLLLRIYDPTDGYITLNGTDIRKFRRKDYYRLFAPVFQNIEIFAFLLGENISLKPMEKTDRDKAFNCASESGLEEKIASLTKGIDTPLTNIVEDDGVDLSGGEKQKLALARALYKGAKIVVLDEPTSALDALAEQALYEKFDDMIGEKSAVYISHRLASTRFCDNVAMFADGKMIEYGTHDELMEKNGEYANMFNTQAQYYQEDLGPEKNGTESGSAAGMESGVSVNE
ncbi:MAG: ABC transporter ATP-binding protein [Lachnospiraceae bacterium]|nr:ABC transporter ATP-binding protein [Lachnospiraceae bacterium]